MNDDSPGIGVSFLIDLGDSFGGLKTLDDLIGTTSANAVREFQRIQAEVSGGLGLEEAAAKFRSLDVAATRALRSAAQEAAAAERAGEALIRQLERQNATFGKSREEIRAMRVEEAARRAEGSKNTDLASRLRAELALLAAAEAQATAAAQADAQARRDAAQAYNLFERAAREGMAAMRAQEAVAAAAAIEREAQAKRDAAFAYGQFELAARRGMALQREQEAAAAAIAIEREAQARREAAFAYGQFELAARRGIAAHREQEAATAADAAALAQLRAMIDPVAAAQDRLNAELAEARRVMTAAGASAQELAAAEDALYARATRATAQHDAMAGAAQRNAGALKTIALQLPDITQGLLTGQPAMTVFIQQGFQIVQVAQMAEGGLRGFGREVAGLALRFAPLLAGVAAVGAGLALFNRWVNEGVDSTQLTRGLGEITGGADATKQELFKLKDATVSFGSTAEALFRVLGKDIATAFVGDMAAMGTSVKSILDDITSYGRKALAGMYAGVAGMKAYLGEIEKGGVLGLGKLLIGQGDPKLLEKTFGAAYTVADNYLGKLGNRVRKEAINIERQKLAEKIGFNNAPKPKTDRHAETLEREARAVEAQIRNLYKLAEAYGVSGAAALIAEARVKAESDAIKKRADIEEMVSRQIRLAIATRVADAAKATAVMNDQARVQAEVNGLVAAGLVPAERANELVQQRMQELPLLYALEVAQQRGLVTEIQKVTDAQKAQQDARANAKAVEIGAFYAGATQQAERQLAIQQEELKLVGATDVARARAMATIQAMQTLQAKGFDLSSAFAKEYIARQIQIADGAVQIRQQTDAYNASLVFQVELVDQLAANVQSAAQGMAEAFGSIGRAFGDIASSMADYVANQTRVNNGRARELDAIRDWTDANAKASKERQINALYDARAGQAQIQLYGDMAASAKGFFKERSTAYKALAAAEKAYRAVQFALSVRAMVQDAAETIRSVLNSGARSTANAAEGISAQAKLPFPANLAAMAATAAALVAAGVAVFGGGGGGSGPTVKSAEDYQKAQGTGSVLGDAGAKSDSINRSLELMMKNSNRDLEYSSEAVKSLRAIESGIGNLAAAVARETKVGGGLDASTLGLGTNTSGGLLGLGGLFSKKVTKELNDSGLQFDGASVASAIAGNISANLYQEILTTTKKSGFLGIGGSTKTTTSTVTSAADAGLTTEVSLLIANMRNAIVDAAGTIGIDGAAAMLDAFQINIGRISFKDLTSEEIESELAAVFSRVGDDMAGAVGGAVAEYQRAGEGMLETLVRLAKEYQTVDVSLRSIGMTFGSVGLASVGARTALVELFGGLDEFTEQTGFFRENFLSEAEQMAPVIAAVRAEMDRLGLAGVTSKDAFKSVVLGLDLSSASGQEMYAALMAVAPAFAKSTDYLASLNGELKETAKTAEQLAAIEKQRRSLEIQLMEATGDTAGALAAKRADELAGMDESLRALQQQVWSAQDAAQAQRDLAAATEEAARATTAAAEEALRAAAALAEQRRGLEIDLMEATGNAVGALAARRADEIAALDASLRPIKEAIFAAQDAAAAQEALAAAQAAATQAAEEQAAAALALAQTRRGMEIELMEALGDASGALAARRADELAGTDASLRALREQIFAAQDAAAANAALAQAQQDAASAAASAAAEMAAAAAQVASQRSSLEIQLMRAQGNEAGAVSAERAAQLAATDESLHALQEQVWAAEDARKAAEAAAQAQAAYAQQMQEAAQDAQQAAQDAEQLRKQRAGMDAQLLDLLGDAAGALALRRQEELAALDASLRPLQQSIWAQEDLATAATAAADRVNDARGVLTDAYKRESDALQQTIDTMGGLGESLRKYRAELAGGDAAAGNAYLAALGQLNVTDAKAARGDAGALAALEAAGKDFLTVSRDQAGSLLDYQRDVARVAAAVDRGIGATDEAVDYAQAQLDALKNSVAGLIDVNESVISVRDAITALQVAIAGNPVPTVPAAPVTATSGGAQPVQVNTAELERRIDSLSARLEVQNTAVAENTGKMSRLMERWEGAGLLIRTDDDTPLLVTSDPA